ncbi:hypothetical protein ANANG_G00320380, partial [Anguilla anguilla]
MMDRSLLYQLLPHKNWSRRILQRVEMPMVGECVQSNLSFVPPHLPVADNNCLLQSGHSAAMAVVELSSEKDNVCLEIQFHIAIA